MAYSDFDLKKVTEDFGLVREQPASLFANVAPVEPSEELRRWLAEFAPLALGFGSEMARSTFIITPVLAEAKRRCGRPVSVIPGLTFDVDKARGLTGVCDYILAYSSDAFTLCAPVFAAVEAKKEDMTGGLGQCAAELVAIRLFNEKEKTPLPAVYGCATSGSVWRFVKLEGNTLFIDLTEYHLGDLPHLLGILVHIAGAAPPL